MHIPHAIYVEGYNPMVIITSTRIKFEFLHLRLSLNPNNCSFLAQNHL